MLTDFRPLLGRPLTFLLGTAAWAPAVGKRTRSPNSFPNDLHQTPGVDPAEPEPVPEDNFDQIGGD